jgi:O-antigen/teichoic acid export membrane protein
VAVTALVAGSAELTVAGIGNRAAVLSLSRLANYGLMLIGPIVVVRLLSVEDFGRYREFLLYASLLQACGTFFIRDSLLYFIPAHPESPWRMVRQTAALTALTSAATVLLLLAADRLAGGAVVGGYLAPLVAYTLVSVNLDFWEYLWIARRRPVAVFLYSAGRLSARLLVVIAAAWLTHDVTTIIWSLVALEAVRLVGSAIVLYALDESRREPPVEDSWRAQLRFCVPSGAASMLSTANRSLSNVVVAKVLGAGALAHYSIGKFSEYIVSVARNSLSAVVLPEMVRRDRPAGSDALVLWKQATVINTIMLFPVAVLIARYAEPLIVTLFGEPYRAAALIMQIHMLAVVRECFDFSPPLRALNRTQPLFASNVVALVTGAVALAVLLPLAGLAGAMVAYVISAFADAAYLCVRTSKLYGVGLRGILPWRAVAKSATAALVAGVVVVNDVWTDTFGLAGIVLAGLAYAVAFAALLLLLRVAEAELLLNWILRALRRIGARREGRCAG